MSIKRSIGERVKCLETGSDDYLTKPFAFSELLARIQTLIRRASGIADSAILAVGGLSLKILIRRIIRKGRVIHLLPLDFSLYQDSSDQTQIWRDPTPSCKNSETRPLKYCKQV